MIHSRILLTWTIILKASKIVTRELLSAGLERWCRGGPEGPAPGPCSDCCRKRLLGAPWFEANSSNDVALCPVWALQPSARGLGSEVVPDCARTGPTCQVLLWRNLSAQNVRWARADAQERCTSQQVEASDRDRPNRAQWYESGADDVSMETISCATCSDLHMYLEERSWPAARCTSLR